MRTLLFLLLPLTAPAQSVSAGIKTGVPFTDLLKTGSLPPLSVGQVYSAKTKRFTVGPTVELRLPFGIGLELDALYKRIGYDSTSSPIANFFSSTTGNRWEFPLLVKYRFRGVPIARPFVAGGVSFLSISGLAQFTRSLVGGSTVTSSTDTPEELRKKSAKGAVMAAGLDVKIPFLHVIPELRYTRWGSDTFRSSTGEFHSSRNQAEFLLGFTF
jgi:hypothetical protein